MFLWFPKNICASLTTNFATCYKVFEVAKLGDIKEACHVLSSSLAWPLQNVSTKMKLTYKKLQVDSFQKQRIKQSLIVLKQYPR